MNYVLDRLKEKSTITALSVALVKALTLFGIAITPELQGVVDSLLITVSAVVLFATKAQ